MAKKSVKNWIPSNLKAGALHKALGVKSTKNIPSSKLSIKKGDSTLMKRRKVFAQNMKKIATKKKLSK